MANSYMLFIKLKSGGEELISTILLLASSGMCNGLHDACYMLFIKLKVLSGWEELISTILLIAPSRMVCTMQKSKSQ